MMAGQPVVIEMQAKTDQLESGGRVATDTINGMTTAVKNNSEATKENTVVKTQNVSTTKTQTEIDKEAAKEQIQAASAMQRFNMSILGLNMSMLGLTFNMRTLAGTNKQLANSVGSIIAPFQVMLTLMGMAISLQQIWNATVKDGNRNMGSMLAAMMAVGFLIGALQTKSMALKAIFVVLAIATATLGAYMWYAATAKAALNGQMGPGGWAIMATGIAMTVGFSIYASRWKSTSKAFSGRVISQPTMMTVGDATEAIIPLQSPRAMEMGITGPNANKSVYIENLNIKANDPESFYRELVRATKYHTYAQPGG